MAGGLTGYLMQKYEMEGTDQTRPAPAESKRRLVAREGWVGFWGLGGIKFRPAGFH